MLKSSIKKIKNWRFKKIVYPAVSILYLLLLLTIFIYTAKFLSEQISRTFDSDDGGSEKYFASLNLADYSLVAKKLGLTPVSEPSSPENQVAPADETLPVETATTAAVSATSAPSSEDIAPAEAEANFKIIVLNASGRTGLAADLKKNLEAAGFPVEKIGNRKEPSELSLIKIKESRNQYPTQFNQIKQIVAAKYQLTATQILEESGSYDIEIVIGKR